MTCIKTGAVIHMVAHNLIFHADLYAVAGAIVVRANGPLHPGANCWYRTTDDEPTHELREKPHEGFWREELGVFVVPAEQVVAL